MKKIITLLCLSFFALSSCSKDDVEPTVPSATATQAILNGATVTVTWSAVAGTGVTYNVYRNDSPIKINAVPVTEVVYTDVLTTTGSYTYTITVNLAGLESEKGAASGKVVFALPTAQATLNQGSVNVTWQAAAGTGITYNVYRNDNPVKINSTPLTEAKFTDVLTTTGDFSYSVTVNLAGQESPKGIASGKVTFEVSKTTLELPKTITNEDYYYDTTNGTTTTAKGISTCTYDPINITKLASVSNAYFNPGSTIPIEISKSMYTYTGNLITKVETVDKAGAVQNTTVYMYNDKNKMISLTSTDKNGYIYKVVYDYNIDGTVSGTNYGNGLLKQSNLFSYLNGNLIKHVSTINNQMITVEFNYDSKNNPFINVLGFSNLDLWSANQNNEISSVSSSSSIILATTRHEYTYNVNNIVLSSKYFEKTGTKPEQLKRVETFTY